jgi:hypothetical protein
LALPAHRRAPAAENRPETVDNCALLALFAFDSRSKTRSIPRHPRGEPVFQTTITKGYPDEQE